MDKFGPGADPCGQRLSARVLDCCGGCTAVRRGIRLRADRIDGIEPAAANADSKLLMPPIANAHDHVRGVRPISIGGFDLPLELWLLYMTGLPPVDPYLVAAAALARQARGGLGSIMVHYTRPQDASRLGEELVTVARAARDVGVRVAIAVALRDRNPLGYAPDSALLDRLEPADRALVRQKLLRAPAGPEEQIRLVDELAARIDDPLVSVQYGPYGMEWCSDALLRLVAERSAETGRRVHMHLLESPLQREYLDHIHPNGPVRYLDEIGLLSPRLSVAHATQLRPDEMELLAERGVIVSVNTSSNLILRNGVAPAAEMHRRGIRLATGLDGFSIDDDDDALRELRLAYMLHRGRGLQLGLPLGELLRAACQTGREAVAQLPEAPLTAGAPADLLELDYAAFAGDAVIESSEAALLMHRATTRHIVRVVVAGREIVRDGRVLGVDLPGIERELDSQVRAGATDFRSWVQVSARIRDRMHEFYTAGLHCCE
jgi:cytosine/adenosine deaminase-related metal-dependent hydrolase